VFWAFVSACHFQKACVQQNAYSGDHIVVDVFLVFKVFFGGFNL